MDKTFEEAINGVRHAERGVDVREDLAQGFEYVKQYAEAVTSRHDEAVQSAKTASDAANTATENAQTAVTSATAAVASQNAASQSASEAKASADAAAKSASEAKAVVSTDTTLSVPGAPADAKAVGDALVDLKLPIATADTLGGVKVGSNLSVAADGTLSGPEAYTLTAEKITAALGFAPVSAASAVQLPYSIVYDHSYVGANKIGSASAPEKIQLNDDYDAIGIIYEKLSEYPAGTLMTWQRVLHELVTFETSGGTFRDNWIPLKGLPSTFTTANKINLTLAIDNRWNQSDIVLRYSNRLLELYGTGNHTYINGSPYEYHIFGIKATDKFLPEPEA